MGNPDFYEFEGRRRERHLKKAKIPGFDKCLEMMRSHYGELREDGFWWIYQHASELVSELIAAFEDEANLDLRSGIIELIAAAKSPDAFPFLAKQLRSDDWVVRKQRRLFVGGRVLAAWAKLSQCSRGPRGVRCFSD